MKKSQSRTQKISRISTSGRVVKRARACQVRAKIREKVRAKVRAKVSAEPPCLDLQCPCRYSASFWHGYMKNIGVFEFRR